MSESDDADGAACCAGRGSCVFSKALQARIAVCERSERHTRGERDVIDCASPVARTHCTTLAALLHERARFALHLPRVGQPLMHAQALRLHCGGVLGLQRALGAAHADVHHLVGAAHERHGSLADLPWDAIIRDVAAWQARRPRKAVQT